MPRSASTTLNYNGGTPRFSPRGSYRLTQNGALTITFSGFPSGATFTKVTLRSFANTSNVVNFPAEPGDVTGIFSFSTNGTLPTAGSQIVITDIESPLLKDRYQLSVHGTANGSAWEADPEVINKPGT